MRSPVNSPLPTDEIRREYPLLERRVNGRPIVYLDSAATGLKPRAVIEAVTRYYTQTTANVHRGVHLLAEEATEQFEQARDTVAAFIGAEPHEIAFTRHATEAIHLVAQSLPPAGRVLYTLLEHHSNFLPWQSRPASRAVGLLADGQLDEDDFRHALREFRPQLVTLSWVSNALGTLLPIRSLIDEAHQAGAAVLVDASQAAAHRPIDVQALGCDYLCFSGHKLGEPSGVGVLYARRTAMACLRPVILGGDMVEEVHADRFTLRPAPYVLEAGTPNVEGVLGLAAACRFLVDWGLESIEAHERGLMELALERFARLPAVALVGPRQAAQRSAAITWTVAGLDSAAVARMLSARQQICVRSGYHCAQPAHEALGLPPTVRASFAPFNTPNEIELLAESLAQITANLQSR